VLALGVAGLIRATSAWGFPLPRRSPASRFRPQLMPGARGDVAHAKSSPAQLAQSLRACHDGEAVQQSDYAQWFCVRKGLGGINTSSTYPALRHRQQLSPPVVE